MTSAGDWRLKMKLEPPENQKLEADIILAIKSLFLLCFFSDPVLTGTVSTLGIFKGMYQVFP